jgi:hypothetical protein
VTLGTQLWIDHQGRGQAPQRSQFMPARLDSDREKAWCKPFGSGLWTSPFKRCYSWLTFLIQDGWCPGDVPLERCDYWLIDPEPTARVYVIDDLLDLRRLLDAHGHAPLRKFGMTRQWIDFTSASLEYDAIHLTENGQWATRLTEPNLYGWDVECVLWLNWALDDSSARRTTYEEARAMCDLDENEEAA